MIRMQGLGAGREVGIRVESVDGGHEGGGWGGRRGEGQ